MQPKDPREVTNMPETYRAPRETLRLLPAALLLSIAGLSIARPAVAAELRYDPGDMVYFTYCHSQPAAMRIRSGDSVITSTRDASNDAFSVSDKSVAPKLDLTKVNPQTGPFYVEGAEPGDTLEVHIDSIEPNRDWGWGASIPYFGLLAPEYKTAMVTPAAPDRLFIWRIDKGRKVPTPDKPNSKRGKIQVPLRTFFGTIGTAPSGKL